MYYQKNGKSESKISTKKIASTKNLHGEYLKKKCSQISTLRKQYKSWKDGFMGKSTCSLLRRSEFVPSTLISGLCQHYKQVMYRQNTNTYKTKMNFKKENNPTNKKLKIQILYTYMDRATNKNLI